ncbi:hypothetical protein [Candidatus Albibeggiatoa sp. nov. BB20]|uniref:hypothetical protein n=1 Tax=Candidatus Albibeggiatoa sp. nov. BB20 TaxID=3162723 RepID=UPI003365AEB7
MKTLTLNIDETLYDTLLAMLQGLPKQKIEIIEETENEISESRWHKIAQRVHEDKRYPAGWSEQLKKDMHDFRENCNFKHDE